MSFFDDIPGYRDAIRRESFIRDASFLPVNEKLAGFEVRPMTLSDYLSLRLIGSPFLVGGDPTPADIRGFLWRLSPQYSTNSRRARWRHMRKCRAFIPPAEPLLRFPWSLKRWAKKTVQALELQGNVLIAIRAYVEDTFQDWPSSKGQGENVSYYSDAASIVASLAREYGWTESAILALPMRRLLQYLKEIRHQGGAKVLFNRSDAIKDRYLADQNKN
jgi:hypothetical protein